MYQFRVYNTGLLYYWVGNELAQLYWKFYVQRC